MAQSNSPTVIKKYANRRLYNTGTSTYVTLDDLAIMVKQEDDFVVVDAKTGQDITRTVLTQIIFEEENKGENLLPISFLRQLIRFYGDQMQAVVPGFLDASISSLTRVQDKFRDHMSNAFGGQAFDLVEEHTRKNMEIFEQAMQMFNPFGVGTDSEASRGGANQKTAGPEGQAGGAGQQDGADLAVLKEQIADMQRKVEALATKQED